jgi:dihydroneopterin aldolase
MDKIVISHLEATGRVGVTAAERASPQRLLVSLELDLDLVRAGQSDDLDATVDYAAVAQTVRQTVGSRERHLIEAVAHDIASTLLRDPLVRSVTVEVKKFSVPGTDHVAVRIVRPST